MFTVITTIPMFLFDPSADRYSPLASIFSPSRYLEAKGHHGVLVLKAPTGAVRYTDRLRVLQDSAIDWCA